MIDYKDKPTLSSFITERAKIVPRRISGLCAAHQRELTTAIKRSRHLALVLYSSAQN
jgi:small subunit ribosomal protein S18